MLDENNFRSFEDARPSLLGLAYRILGTMEDAEDAVQDTFVKWMVADRQAIDNAVAWLTTTCTRRCLDLLRSAHRSRVSYVGAWLPEPIQTPLDDDSARLELASSITTGFLLMLERLTPKERAAYLLREIFDASYTEIAETLDMQDSACRKLVSRAKRNIDRAKVRQVTPLEQQDRLLTAFREAVTTGSTMQLASLLSDDARLCVDGGGKVPALPDVLRGKTEITTWLSERTHHYWAGHRWMQVNINGARGFFLEQEGTVVATASFSYDEAGQANGIYIMRNPDKLARLRTVAIH